MSLGTAGISAVFTGFEHGFTSSEFVNAAGAQPSP
ncbi:hypothetical protein SYYSPA8_12660 [Streptomyces yaizuensis]|uniref:Uncharacterized protein n=1 Tax=Streptomyces yaizuensis TaxID=2989713 RepID=A0ABQ5NYX0_9ACTN|nr:hypothetical protein SYYSPA8_12660 [Streptomyces sp. YSPA8]